MNNINFKNIDENTTFTLDQMLYLLDIVEERLLDCFSDYSDDRHLYRQDHIRDSIQDAVEYYRSQFE